MSFLREATQRRLWNNSVSRHLRDCSSVAQSFIRVMIERNREMIGEVETDIKLEGRRKPVGV